MQTVKAKNIIYLFECTRCSKQYIMEPECHFNFIINNYVYRINGLVSLFNGISTFVGYLMPKPFSLKNSSDTI